MALASLPSLYTNLEGNNQEVTNLSDQMVLIRLSLANQPVFNETSGYSNGIISPSYQSYLLT